jgi:hypothetical protein
MARSVVVLLPLLALLAGCLSSPPSNPPVPGVPDVPTGPHLGADLVPKFTLPKIIDSLRAGGEPVIAITPKGTVLVSAHPGYTHWHPDPTAVPPTSAELLVPTQGQSYMWRSADGGQTFKVVSLLPLDNPPNAGPRGVGQGVSDPDFAVDSKGRIYFTDLESLADASVSWSDDDGASWLMGNNDAAGGEVDRNWLTTFGTTVYFRGNGINDVRKSEDGGRTWTSTGSQSCGGDIVANPLNGHLYIGCVNGFTMSEDGGKTWDARTASARAGGPIEPEPAIDANGTVYRAFDAGRGDIVVAYTKDEGKTWNNYSLQSFFPGLQAGTMLWPWTSAGSGGRISVTFYGSPTADAFSAPSGEWFVYNAIIVGADTGAPAVYPTQVTPAPFHKGPMCQGGTTCQATTAVNDQSDRRLGDFFETTIDHEGFVHIVYADTETKSSDTISHVGYVRLLDGPRLVDGPVPAGFPTQG